MLEGIDGEYAIDTWVGAVNVSPKDHTGWAPFGAAIVMRIRLFAR
jgi:hypothetical protein